MVITHSVYVKFCSSVSRDILGKTDSNKIFPDYLCTQGTL